LDDYYLVRSTHKEPKQTVEVDFLRKSEKSGSCIGGLKISSDLMLASCGNDNSVKLWNENGKLLTNLVFDAIITCLSENNNKFLFCGSGKGQIFMVPLSKIDLKFSENKAADKFHSKRERTSEITALDFEPECSILVAASKGMNFDVYKVSESNQNFEIVKRCDYKPNSIENFTQSPETFSFTKINFGKSADSKTQFIRLSNLEHLFHTGLCYSIQHEQFVSDILAENNLSEKFEACLWKSSTLSASILSKTVRNNFQQAEINTLAVGNDGLSVVLGDDNGLLHLCENVHSFCEKKTVYGGHAAHVRHVKFFGDGEFLVSTGGEDMSIFIWKVE